MTRNTRIKTNNFFYLLNKINTEPILLYVVQKNPKLFDTKDCCRKNEVAKINCWKSMGTSDANDAQCLRWYEGRQADCSMYSPVEESHARRTWYIRKAEGTVGCCPIEDRNVFNSPLSRTTRASRNQKNIPSLAAYVGGYETYYTTRFRWGCILVPPGEYDGRMFVAAAMRPVATNSTSTAVTRPQQKTYTWRRVQSSK